MMTRLRIRVRRWLLGAAILIRNRVESVVSELEPTDGGETGGGEWKAAAPAGDKAHPGGPPDHWLRLVSRHAPELLDPDLRIAFFGAPPPEGEPGREPERATEEEAESSAGPDIHGMARFDGSPEGGTAAAPPAAARPPGLTGRENVADENPIPKGPLDMGGADADAWPPNNPDRLPDSPAGDPYPEASGTPQRGAVSPVRSPEAPSPERGARRHLSSLSPETAMPQIPAGGAEPRPSRAPVGRKSALSGVAVIRKRREAGWSPQPSRRDQAEPSGPETPSARSTTENEDRAFSPPSGSGTRPVRPVRQATADEARPPSAEPVSAWKPVSAVLPERPETRIDAGGIAHAPVPEDRMGRGWPPPRFQSNSETVELKSSPSPLFRWPGLPGEGGPEETEPSHRGPSWPRLPGGSADGAGGGEDRSAIGRWETASRDSERLRRLDEEQGGGPWNAWRF